MKPFSEDLRARIAVVYEETELSYPQVADRFNVSESSVRRFVKQWRETGTVTPKPPAKSQHPKLDEEHVRVLAELVKTQVDASQEELRERLAKATGLRVSQPTLCRTLQRARITRKKRRNGPKSSSGRTSKRPVSNSRKRESAFGLRTSLRWMRWVV